jgi:hypothetical protein
MDTTISPSTANVSDNAESQLTEESETGFADAASLAPIITFAEGFDLDAAKKAAADVEADQTTALSEAITASGKILRRSSTQEKTSRKTLYKGLSQILEVGQLAYEQPEFMIALAATEAAKKKIKTTAASWRAPFLILIKLAHPELDDKTASLYGRVLNYIAALGLSGEPAELFLAKHGIGALAAEEAKRQKARKQGTEATPAEDPVEVFCRGRTPAPLPEALRPAEPGKGTKLALMIVGDHRGQFVAWDLDTHEKRTLVAVRQAAKRGQPEGWPATKVESNDDEK